MDIIQKTKADYNKIAKHFAITRARVWPEMEQFSPLIKNGQHILDWGCGGGRLLLVIGNKKVKYFGLDQSHELLKIARVNYKRYVKSGVAKFICTARQEKKFPNNYFDLVFMISSFFHLPDVPSRLKLLAKTYQELKPGGQLIITVWNLGSDWAKAKQNRGWKKIAKNDFLIPWKNSAGEIIAERYYHHFTPQELKNLLTKTGFKITKIGYFGKDWSDSKGGRSLVAIATKK